MMDDAPPECGVIIPGYCTIKKPKIDVTCHNVKKQAGDMILFEVNDRTCYCICSCLSRGTRVTTNDAGGSVKVQNIVQDQTSVLAAGLDLKFQPQTVRVVSHSKAGRIDHAIYLKYKVDGEPTDACVTASHPFLLKDGTLVSAECLSLASELVDRRGRAVEIESLDWGTYEGEFWEFSTRDDIPDKELTDHLVITNGVVTGDFAVEQWVHYKRPMFTGAMPPIVGSPEWVTQNKPPLLTAEQNPVRKVGEGYFYPAVHSAIRVPAHAASFFPSVEARRLGARRFQKPYNDPMAHEMCIYLIQRLFQPAYPDIVFHFDWFSYDANTYSWVDPLGQRQVLICGGLARIKCFDIEAVALALAHEVGHLDGKPDVGGHVTCEGEADWWGGSVVLRQLWFGQDYFDKTKEAIAQLEAAYAYLKTPGEDGSPPDTTTPLDNLSRAYPSHACRIETFKEAMKGVDQPECSQCKAP